MEKYGRLIMLTLLMIAVAAGPALAEKVIGSVKTAKGQGQVVRSNETIPAKVGVKLMEDDVLKTGTDGTMGVLLRDDTSLSLGPDSEIILDEFVFEPAEGNLSLVTNMVKGTAAYLSGQISKLKPEAARFETPLATIGIRGTRFVVKVEPQK